MNTRFRLLPLLVAGLLVLPARAQPPTSDPETAYRAAYQFIARERYDEAYTAMQAFERTYAQSRHADEAGFWACFSLEHLTARRADADACYGAFGQRHPQSAWRDDAETRRLQLAARASGGLDAARTAAYNDALAERLGSVYTASARAPVARGGTNLRLTRDRDASVEVLAVQALARPGNDAAISDLRELALESPSVAVRQASIGALARIGTERSGAALGEIIGGLLERAAQRDTVAAMTAAEAVNLAARPGNNTLLPFVERYFRSEGMEISLRRALLTATLQMGTAEARAFQWRVVQRHDLAADERAEVIQWLAAGSGFTADELTRLAGLMRSERDANVRDGYARALRTFVFGASRSYWTNGFSTTAFGASDVLYLEGQARILSDQARILSDDAANVTVAGQNMPASAPTTYAEARVSAEERRRTREVLVAQALDIAAAQLQVEQDTRVQMSLAGALAAPGFDRGVEPLLALALNTGADEAVRSEAPQMLGLVGTEAAYVALLNVLRRADEPRVLRAAMMAIVGTAAFRVRADAVPELIRHTRSADLSVRRTAVDALGRLDAPEARQALLDLIRSMSGN